MRFNLELVVFLCLIQLARLCEIEHETCECVDINQMKCLKTYQATLLDFDLLKTSEPFEVITIQNKNVSTLNSRKIYKASSLNIFENFISFLNEYSFEGMTNLSNLSLNNNHLQHIEPLTFHNLIKLKYLYLFTKNSSKVHVCESNKFNLLRFA